MEGDAKPMKRYPCLMRSYHRLCFGLRNIFIQARGIITIAQAQVPSTGKSAQVRQAACAQNDSTRSFSMTIYHRSIRRACIAHLSVIISYSPLARSLHFSSAGIALRMRLPLTETQTTRPDEQELRPSIKYCDTSNQWQQSHCSIWRKP